MKLPNEYNKSDQVWRAKFSSLSNLDLKKAFEKLYKPDKNLSDSVLARHILDLKLGCSLTRFQTK